jgi:hypothetical protein
VVLDEELEDAAELNLVSRLRGVDIIAAEAMRTSDT